MTENPQHGSWDEPPGVAARGTVIVAAGRGEQASAYERFGRRISADGYRVRVLDDVTVDVQASLAAAGKLLVDDAVAGPTTVIGTDAGALFATTLAARQAPGLDAVVLVGLPAAARPVDATAAAGITLDGITLDWPDEVEARTACPNHQRVLSGGAVRQGALFSAQIPTELIEHAGFTVFAVPALGLHGDDDRISPLDQARARYPQGPRARLVTIAGGRHDLLNDVSHRTVAATIVLFLERLRLGPDLPEIARDSARADSAGTPQAGDA
jgi:alpha-beta hydrolase superfamily lysophospholipase